MSPTQIASSKIRFALRILEAVEERRQAPATRGDTMTIDEFASLVMYLNCAQTELDDVQQKCLHCGGDNARSGDFCSDRCRANYSRERMPRGIVKSVRRLARGRAGVTIHYEPDEAERAVRLVVGQSVHLAAERAQE